MKFRFIDAIHSWSAFSHIRGVKAVSFEEYNLRERLGHSPALPESLVLESFFQLGNWLIMLSTDFRQCGMIVRFERVEFLAPVLQGQRLEMEVRIVTAREDGWVLAGEGHAGGRVVVRGFECLATPVSVEELHDPADLRVLFSEIHRPAPSNAP